MVISSIIYLILSLLLGLFDKKLQSINKSIEYFCSFRFRLFKMNQKSSSSEYFLLKEVHWILFFKLFWVK